MAFSRLLVCGICLLTVAISGCSQGSVSNVSKVPAATDENFAKALEASNDQPVLVDFWAPWCGPCLKLGPTVEKVAGKYDGRVTVLKVNIDESPVVASRYSINAIPALLVFRDGEVVDRLIGVQRQNAIESMLEKVLQ